MQAGGRGFLLNRYRSGNYRFWECSDGRNPKAVVGAIEDMKPLLINQDPRPYEMRFWDLIRGTRQSPWYRAKAIAGIELALVDIKAKALGISVVELFGGPTRKDVRVYWSHCGTSRATSSELLGTPPLKTMQDIADLGREVVSKGFTALKTNIILPVNRLRFILLVLVVPLVPLMEQSVMKC